MKLTKLYYYDDKYKWKLEPVEFLPNINLLVGVSGVGKTRILRAIDNLKDIADGSSLNGVEWNICFTSSDHVEYLWSGKFETKESMIPGDTDTEEEEGFKILREQVICDKEVVISRSPDGIIFNGVKTPKLSPYESSLELLRQEDIIAPIRRELERIVLVGFDSEDFTTTWSFPLSLYQRYKNTSVSILKESKLPANVKLAVLSKELPNEFEKVKTKFIEIFPNVLDIKIDNVNNEDIPESLSELMKNALTIKIKEKKVEGWIKDASSGMIKTLFYISELYLSPEHSVIMIDEIENSLGVNCLNSVTELILNDRHSQFIITSHHPYIINNVSPAYWRIVTRQGSSVTVKSAKDFHISDSRQKAFIDLINVLEEEEESDA